MKNLSSVLGALGLEELQSIATMWGTDLPSATDSRSRLLLEQAIRDTLSARFVWEKLTSKEVRVLYAILGPAARNWSLAEALPAKVDMSETEVRNILDHLHTYHLVLEEDAKVQGNELHGQHAGYYGYGYVRPANMPVEIKPIVYVPTEIATVLYPTGREMFLEQGDRSIQTLDQILGPYRQGDLDQIAKRFGLAVSTYYSRPELRGLIAESLVQADAVLFALNCLTPSLRSLYLWVGNEQGGKVLMSKVRERLRVDGAKLAAVIRTFEEYAIAFDTFSSGSRVLFIPRETLANLSKIKGAPRSDTVLKESSNPDVVRSSDTPVLWDIVQFMSAVYRQEVELTRTGAVPKRVIAKISPTLVSDRTSGSEDDALEYIDILKHISKDLGLIQGVVTDTDDKRMRLVPGTKLDSWVRSNTTGQVRRLYRRWIADRSWSDVPGVNYKEWYPQYIDLPILREATHKVLSQCQPEVWYDIKSFISCVRRDDPFALRPSQRYAGDAGYKLASELRSRWDECDGELIIGVLRSTLFEMGIVSLGYDGSSQMNVSEVNPTSFMLTEFGASVISSTYQVPSLMESERPVIVQPNFEILVMHANMPALYTLIRFTDPEQIGRVSRFNLSKESFMRGMTDGMTQVEVQSFLEEQSQKLIPQNVIYTMKDWVRQYKEALMSKKVVLETENDLMAKQLMKLPEVATFQLTHIGPCLLQVTRTSELRDLGKILNQAGYITKVQFPAEESQITISVAVQAAANGLSAG